MSHEHKGNPVATYIITALILGVITYFEYAIVEYEISWLSRGAILFWLVALSVLKFIMVVAIFMHLKDDEKTYTGFFSSGMVLALATFIILPLLFTVNTIPQPVQAGAAGAHSEEPEEHSEARESLGEDRGLAAELDAPQPRDASLQVAPPAAGEPRAEVRQEAGDGAQVQAETSPEEAEGEPVAGQEPDGQQAEQQAAAGAQAQPDGEGATTEFDRELGQSVYTSTCAGCHGPEGAGMPGVFPPLAGNVPQIYNAGGREYLVDVVLHGLTGPIDVNGQTYNGAMPAWSGSLSDEQVAAVVNHVLTAWGNEAELEEFTAVGASEAEQNRGEDPGNLNERRAELMAQ